MGIIIHKKKKLKNPILIASWPGIGNIGLIAVEYMRQQLKAEVLADIEPEDFFYPVGVTIENGILEDLQFPASRFYYHSTEERDLLFFIAEEQPHGRSKKYAEGSKAYEIATMVIDFAEKHGCSRIYTSGAAVAMSHHTNRPRVWVVPNRPALIKEVKELENVVLMSEIHGPDSQGTISGLNGLLLGVARERGIEGFCVMGEIPVYLQGMPLPYPKASKSVLEVLCKSVGVAMEYHQLDLWTEKLDKKIDKLIEEFGRTLPVQFRDGVKGGLEKLKGVPEKIQVSEEDARKAIEEMEEFFKRGGTGNEEKPF
jgi:uncharacterized protein